MYEYFQACLPYELHLEDSLRQMREGGSGQSLAFPFDVGPQCGEPGVVSRRVYLLVPDPESTQPDLEPRSDGTYLGFGKTCCVRILMETY